VVGGGDVAGHLKEGDPGELLQRGVEGLGADFGVGLHDVKLAVAEPARPTRNIKLSDETVELVPGAEEAVQAVYLIYRRRFIDGWGCWKISKELDSLGIPSPSGKRWNKESVMDILTNSIYLGGVANRLSAGIYFNRAPGMPIEAKTQLKELNSHKRAKVTLRPREDWIESKEEALVDFLPQEVRAAAVAFQAEYWKRRELAQPQPKRNKHADSSYIRKCSRTRVSNRHCEHSRVAIHPAVKLGWSKLLRYKTRSAANGARTPYRNLPLSVALGGSVEWKNGL